MKKCIFESIITTAAAGRQPCCKVAGKHSLEKFGIFHEECSGLHVTLQFAVYRMTVLLGAV